MNGHVRLVAALALIAASCGGGPAAQPDGPSKVGEGLDVPATATPDGTPRPGDVAVVTPRPAGQRTPTPAPRSGDGGTSGGPVQRNRDAGQVGENALAYLRPSTPKLVVEIDAVRRKAPVQTSVDHLRSVLGSVLGKPGGIDLPAAETFEAVKDEYSIEDIRRIESEHRQTSTTDELASMYFLFLNGSFAGNDHVLGLSYSASATVIFTDRVAEAQTAIVSRVPIERAVMAHEAGHLLGLVNIGYTSPRDHEDPVHESHSKNQASVMFWAVESIDVVRVLGGGSVEPPADFDADDRADLEDRKAGRL